MSKVKTYAKSIAIPLLVGGVVSLLITGSIDYDSLEKPLFAPPSIVFPIIWSILYILMGVSFGMLETKGLVDKSVKTIYYTQLVFNALWPIAFFVLKWRLFSFIWIVILAILVILMAVRFYKKDKIAGLLQIPYVIWCLFASYLNLFVFLLNR